MSEATMKESFNKGSDALKDYMNALKETTQNEKALKYMVLKSWEKMVKAEVTSMTAQLLAEKVDVKFPSMDKKVVVGTGNVRSTINVPGLAGQLMTDGRIKEFFDIATVSQKAITETFDDSEQLLTKYKETSAGNPAIKISKMVKEDY